MPIKSMHPAPGWRAAFVLKGGEVRIAPVAFFAHAETVEAPRYGQDTPGKIHTEIIPLVANDHDFATSLVPADELGPYALLGPGDEVEKHWLDELRIRVAK